MLNAPMLGAGKPGRHFIVPEYALMRISMRVKESSTKNYGVGRFKDIPIYDTYKGWITSGYDGEIRAYGGKPAGGQYTDSTDVFWFTNRSLNMNFDGNKPIYVGCLETMKIQAFYPDADSGYRGAVSKSLVPFFPTMEGNYHIFITSKPISLFALNTLELPEGSVTCKVSNGGNAQDVVKFLLQAAAMEGIVDGDFAQRHWYVVSYDVSEAGGTYFLADYEGTSFFGAILKENLSDSELPPVMTYYCAETGFKTPMKGKIVNMEVEVGIYAPDLARKTSQYAPFPLAKNAIVHITFTDKQVFWQPNKSEEV